MKPLLQYQERLATDYHLDMNSLVNPQYFSCEPKEFLFHDGDAFENLFFILKGDVEILLSGDGYVEMPISHFHNYGIFDVSSLFLDDGVYHYDARCVSETEVLTVPLALNKSLLMNQLAFVSACAKHLSVITDSLHNHQYLKKWPLEKKLCSYIAFMRTSEVWNDPLHQACIDLQTSQRHIDRTLSLLCEKGILEKVTDGYRIKDVIAFEKMNDGSFFRRRNKYGEIIREHTNESVE